MGGEGVAAGLQVGLFDGPACRAWGGEEAANPGRPPKAERKASRLSGGIHHSKTVTILLPAANRYVTLMGYTVSSFDSSGLQTSRAVGFSLGCHCDL